ncbi:MAG: 3-phosphoglycerate dehydrogenase [Clostridiales bacterium]|jgi:D-3-phosphoglycerate dehydrogenase|nr:3-phosphoglycerate dehydrogenase [Clostridiales bacterium]
MYNILTLNKIAEIGTDNLPKEHYSVSDKCENPDAIMLRSFNMHETNLPQNLKAVARAGAGTNNIPIDKCSEKGVVVFNTPGANANAVKELVLASLFLSCRKIYQGINWAQTLKGEGDKVPALVEKGKAQFAGPEIAGKKLGVIGLGAIGGMVANACKALGMEVLGCDPFISVDGAWGLSRGVHKAANYDEIYAQCDYITVHVPYNEQTKGMFNAEVFGKVKKGLKLLNFSRGELVDNSAVKEALANGSLSCYVTDFPNEELLGTEGVIAIPHLGASTYEAEDNCAVMAAIQLKDYLEYGNIKNSVNFPDCNLPFTGRKRFCILHKNVPGVVGPITTAVANAKLNIDNMINKSKTAYACTMIDVDQKETGNAVDEILKVDGVVSVRVI